VESLQEALAMAEYAADVHKAQEKEKAQEEKKEEAKDKEIVHIEHERAALKVQLCDERERPTWTNPELSLSLSSH